MGAAWTRPSTNKTTTEKDSWTNQIGDNNLGAHPLSETPAMADPELTHGGSKIHLQPISNSRRISCSSTLETPWQLPRVHPRQNSR
ncbi:hypothetical protein Bca101_043745 [Brassica carinata]